MADQPILFDDGAAYEHGMGVWSRAAGQTFLDWVSPPAGLRWVDIGCGNGAFTYLLSRRCAPSVIEAIDPSDGQLAYARTRLPRVAFHQGSAMALPFADRAFDAAVMALVLFFVPDPAVGVAEMVRVVRPGGLVCAYVWDIHGGGLPIEPVRAALREAGVTAAIPPSADVSRMPALQAAWLDAGLTKVETLEIPVQREFDDFEAFWTASLLVANLADTLDGLPADMAARVKARTRELVQGDKAGAVLATARAHAIKGTVART